MKRDLVSNIAGLAAIKPGALITADETGEGIDLKDFDSCAFILNPGTITDGTHTPKLQESADDSTYTDVAAVDQEGTLAAIASDTMQEVGYKGNKRYARLFVTVTGSPSTGGYYSAVAVKGHGHGRP